MIDDANPYVISIHALHEESDEFVRALRHRYRYFNPRSP